MSIVSVSAGQSTLRDFVNLATQKIKCLIVNEVDKGKGYPGFFQKLILILGGPQTTLRLLQPLVDQPKYLVIMTSNLENLNATKEGSETFDARFVDRMSVQLKMEMTAQLRMQVLERTLAQNAPDLICPPPIKAELLKKAEKSIRDMIRVVKVSATRSRADGYNILFIYPLQ